MVILILITYINLNGIIVSQHYDFYMKNAFEIVATFNSEKDTLIMCTWNVVDL